MVGRGDDDGVDAGIVEHVAVLHGAAAVVTLDQLDRPVEATPVHVADTHHGDVVGLAATHEAAKVGLRFES